MMMHGLAIKIDEEEELAHIQKMKVNVEAQEDELQESEDEASKQDTKILQKQAFDALYAKVIK